MAERGTIKEELAGIKVTLVYIVDSIKETKEQLTLLDSKTQKRWDEHDIKGAIVNINDSKIKIESLTKSQKEIDNRLTKVEHHIKAIQWFSSVVFVFIIIPILGFIAKFLNVKIDADKIIPLGIIEASELLRVIV